MDPERNTFGIDHFAMAGPDSHTKRDITWYPWDLLKKGFKASHETVQRWKAAIQTDARQWDWLRVKLILVKNAPADMAPGVYTIDRYGTLLTHWPLTSWNFESLEKEFLYYEARHC